MRAIKPEPAIGHDIGAAIRVELGLCYTCGSCAAECPVNRATDRLQPLKYIRMAGFGMTGELLRSPEIWYCLSCNRCSNICPMTVKPGALLFFVRKEAALRTKTPAEIIPMVGDVAKQLHRVRWHAASLLKNGDAIPEISSFWNEMVNTPVEALSGPLEYLSRDAALFRKSFSGFLGRMTNFSSCFTCCECTNSCPVFRERSVFDPMRIFRMVALGLREELLASASIWLCIGCQSCTHACGQLVRGHMLLQRAQELAIEGGFVDRQFPDRWKAAQKVIFAEYIRRIDVVLHNAGFAESGGAPARDSEFGEPGYETVHTKPLWRAADARYGPAL